MLSVRIEPQLTPFGDPDEDCNHADFFFSDGYVASCYHNEEHMVTEYYLKPVDVKLFDKVNHDELGNALSYIKMQYKSWENKQFIDEEIVIDILDYYAPGELVNVK